MKKTFYSLLLSLFLLIPSTSQARINVADWYIQNFESQIEVRENSTLLITEKITADCGNAVGKHGIFRVLPTQLKTTKKTIPMPVRLMSIKDFSGKDTPYSIIENSTDKTITWKIGDKNKTVTGVNEYEIVYEVGNVINSDSQDWDELYWNVTGNFWDLEIDKFRGEIIFPEGINEANTQIQYYTGNLGANKKDATYKWTKNILEISSIKTLKVGEGITFSVTFPKSIITPYEFSFWEKYKNQISFSLGMIIFAISFVITYLSWKKYGKDPKAKKTIIAEFEAPDNLTPLEMGILMNNGSFKNELITASIINLAVKGIIKIEELEKSIAEKFSLLGQKNIQLTLIDSQKLGENNKTEKILFKKMLNGKKAIKIHELKGRALEIISEAKKKAINDLVDKKLINKTGLTLKIVFMIIGSIFIFVTFISITNFIAVGLFLSAISFLIFGYLMPQRTPKGAETNWKIKGFKLYMETAEKHRQQFYEKENIFEKLLPYAIVFGMAKLWAKKMEEIYGPEYFKNYHPIWYSGLGSGLGSFDAGSFTDSLNSISTSISANVSTGSGAGGGGGSGGGGGGGGGGGW